jgi:hypothetical protein
MELMRVFNLHEFGYDSWNDGIGQCISY